MESLCDCEMKRFTVGVVTSFARRVKTLVQTGHAFLSVHLFLLFFVLFFFDFLLLQEWWFVQPSNKHQNVIMLGLFLIHWLVGVAFFFSKMLKMLEDPLVLRESRQ